MSVTLPIYQKKEGPSQILEQDWYGRPARHEAAFRLWLDNEQLHFHFQAGKEATCDRQHQAGDFVEGLWEQDVAELFVMGPDGSYQELNLSPRGAWWCATFSSYRQRSRVWAPSSVRTSGVCGDGFWQAHLSIALADLAVLPGRIGTARMNVTAILEPSDPEYLSFGHRSSGIPDFHADCNFLDIRLI